MSGAELIAVAKEHGLPVHLDGARIFNAAASAGIPAAELAGGCDTVMFCLSKGLAAPVGSLLIGDADLIAEARRVFDAAKHPKSFVALDGADVRPDIDRLTAGLRERLLDRLLQRSYEAMLDSDAVDAVYIPLPNSLHHPWTMRALAAGKHVLCEKPYTRHPAEIDQAWDAAEHAGVVLMEAFMWRHTPQAARLLTAAGDPQGGVEVGYHRDMLVEDLGDQIGGSRQASCCSVLRRPHVDRAVGQHSASQAAVNDKDHCPHRRR